MRAGRRRFGELALLAGALLLVGAAPAAGAAQMVPPDVLVKNVTQTVVGIVSRDKDIQSGDTQKVIALVEREVVPHFNFEDMTAMAVARNWRSASAQQKKELVDEFRKLLVRTYANALATYRGEKFEFLPLHAPADATDVTVRVRVLRPGQAPVNLDYAMEKMPGGWQVYDVLVDGVSLLTNYRTDFANEVRSVGIDGLIKALRAKNRQLARDASASSEQK